jgi:uncharacterized membrane protein
MADQATQRMTIGVPPARCYEAVLDFEQYPAWARDLKSATVLEHDDQGRGTVVAFRAAAMGRSTSYTLRYDHGGAPKVLAWQLVEGDIMRRLDGSYEFLAVDGDATGVREAPRRSAHHQHSTPRAPRPAPVAVTRGSQ